MRWISGYYLQNVKIKKEALKVSIPGLYVGPSCFSSIYMSPSCNLYPSIKRIMNTICSRFLDDIVAQTPSKVL